MRPNSPSPVTPAPVRTATLQWTGILTSVLLIGWAIGGVVFGRVADRLGSIRPSDGAAHATLSKFCSVSGSCRCSGCS